MTTQELIQGATSTTLHYLILPVVAVAVFAAVLWLL